MSSSSPKIQTATQPWSIRSIGGPLVAVIVGMFMVLLDSSAINVAVPALVRQFDSSLPVVQWSLTGYILAEAAVIPLAGWLSDRFGAKRVFLLAIVWFTVSSLLCAIAQDAGTFIAFRILQGLGGGMVMPIGISMIYRISPQEKIGTVMGMVGVPILIAPAIAPAIAGMLVDYASWPYIFLLNLPVGIAGVWLGIRKLPRLERGASAKLDLPGLLLAPLAFASLVYGVSRGGDAGWGASSTLAGLAVGAAALIALVLAELRREQPLLDLRVFRSFAFTRAILIQWIVAIAFYGLLFLNPVLLQQAKGYGAWDTGLLLLPQAVLSAVFIQLGGRWFDRIGLRPLVIAGMALIGLGAFLLSRLSANDGISTLILPFLLAGSGQALFGMGLNAYLFQAAPPHLAGRVASLTGAFQQVMASFGVAGLATLLASRLRAYADSASPAESGVWMHAFKDAYLAVAAVAFAGALLGFTIRARRSSERPVANGDDAGSDDRAADGSPQTKRREA
ncbi:MDR family MFS transporter [Cohnella nanjingensis]|uniref:Multidrug efflux MFS transporter n=1 Tax=Cohnella nanjingensis TaxID=1387779 RepID=A0A7X0RTA3_9BACL|nr:MDR family MFS transporter [Cohnella nanjingensis]MBB6673308.1 multidrug efflux MFS transporter [Cohnella nanjingensis]